MENMQRRIGTFIMRLATAIQNTVMYPGDHPQVLTMTSEAFDLLNRMLRDKPDLSILLVGDYISADNKPLLLPDFYKSAFIRSMKTSGLEWLSFQKGVPFAQFEDLIRSFAASGNSLMNSTKYIKLGKIKLKDAAQPRTSIKPGPESHDHGLGNVLDLGLESKEQMIRTIYQICRDSGSINLDMVNHVVSDLSVIVRESRPLKLLAAIKSHDEYTFTHSSNVGILAMSLAQRLGFNEYDLNQVGIAALLHDVGKTTTPDDILLKKGPLSAEERTVMEEHSLRGAMYLMKLKGVSNLTILAAMEHHIKYDGSGYPRIKGGWKPNIVSQIITVADVYDALRSIRPYREAMTHDQIIGVLTEESGTTFNPCIVRQFIRLIEQ